MLLSNNAFTVLGLKQRFTLDCRELDRRQREAFVARSSEGAFALEAVNEAYRRLRSPVTRAELLFDLRGWSTRITASADLLMRVFTEREEIEQAKARGDQAFLLNWLGTARQRHEALCSSLGQMLDDEQCRGAAAQTSAALVLEELRYLTRALSEAESALHAFEEALLES